MHSRFPAPYRNSVDVIVSGNGQRATFVEANAAPGLLPVLHAANASDTVRAYQAVWGDLLRIMGYDGASNTFWPPDKLSTLNLGGCKLVSDDAVRCLANPLRPRSFRR